MLKVGTKNLAQSALLLALSLFAASSHGDGLRDALQAALRNHPAVAGQAAAVEAKRFAADEARSQRLPTLSAQARQNTKSEERSGISEDDLSNPTVLSVRQPLWAFGRINSGIAAAEAEVDTERADLLRVRRQLLEETAVTYALVLGGDQRVKIAQQNVAQHKELLAQIERRVAGQLASSADTRLAATRLLQAQAAFEQELSEWRGAQEELVTLTQTPIRAQQPIPTGLLEVNESTDLIELSMKHSAEVQLKQEQLALAEAEVKQAKTSAMPTIYLQADKFYDQPGLEDNSQVSVVFEGSLDGLGFAARGRAGEAAANQSAASQDLAATRLELRRTLERLQRNRRLQSDLIELQRQSVS